MIIVIHVNIKNFRGKNLIYIFGLRNIKHCLDYIFKKIPKNIENKNIRGMKSYSPELQSLKIQRNNNNKHSLLSSFLSLSLSLSLSPCMDFAKAFETNMYSTHTHTHFLDNERAKAKPYFSLFQHDDTTTK